MVHSMEFSNNMQTFIGINQGTGTTLNYIKNVILINHINYETKE